jgi:preprotein translocase subunit SecE
MAKSVVTHIMDADNIGGKLKSWPLRVKAFYNDVRTEMKKVTSPSFKEVRATTLVVIITVAIFGLYFWVIDSLIGKGVNQVFKYFRH